MVVLHLSLIFALALSAGQAFVLPLREASSLSRAASYHETMLYHQAVSPALAETPDDVADIPALKADIPVASYEALDIRAGRIVKAETIADPEHDNKASRK